MSRTIFHYSAIELLGIWSLYLPSALIIMANHSFLSKSSRRFEPKWPITTYRIPSNTLMHNKRSLADTVTSVWEHMTRYASFWRVASTREKINPYFRERLKQHYWLTVPYFPMARFVSIFRTKCATHTRVLQAPRPSPILLDFFLVLC